MNFPRELTSQVSIVLNFRGRYMIRPNFTKSHCIFRNGVWDVQEVDPRSDVCDGLRLRIKPSNPQLTIRLLC